MDVNVFITIFKAVYFPIYWRASGVSETLSGVTQLKIGDICLFIICVDIRMSLCTLYLAYFCIISVFDPVPNFTKQNTPVYLSLIASS